MTPAEILDANRIADTKSQNAQVRYGPNFGIASTAVMIPSTRLTAPRIPRTMANLSMIVPP